MKRKLALGAALAAAAALAALPLVADHHTGSAAPTAGDSREMRVFDFTYTAKIENLPENAGKVSIWLPYPVSDDHQQITDVQVSSPYETSIRRDGKYGNSILYVSVNDPAERNIEVGISFRVNRSEYLHNEFGKVPDASREPLPKEVRRWLEPDELVPLDKFVKNLAKEVTEGKKTDLEKARAIYDHVVATMSYDKSGEGWGRGDIYYACNARKGNCTDFHALFIGLCRAVGIPAKFAIGFPLPGDRGEGEIGGYHCWAEFYLRGFGWVPVDTSEARKNPDRKEYFFGAHDENRVQFTIGRDIVLDPKQSSQPMNFFIYPHVEVDGKAFEQVKRKFQFRDVEHPTAARSAS